LIEHAQKMQNQEINVDEDVHAVGGVKATPVFATTPLSHFITPVLHACIGKEGNNVLDNFVAELQAAAEGCTGVCHADEVQEAQATKARLGAEEELAQFKTW
jgi:hypothetical protein